MKTLTRLASIISGSAKTDTPTRYLNMNSYETWLSYRSNGMISSNAEMTAMLKWLGPLAEKTAMSANASVMTKISEADPNGKQPHEAGAKLDAGKVSAFQGFVDYFPRAMREVAAVSTFGASKYKWKGWESVPNGINRYSDAMVRHLISAATGESTDSDSGLLHKAHAAWNAMAVLELALRERQPEDGSAE